MAKDKPKDEDISCEICGNRIPKARLKAMPDATLCVKCAEEDEKENPPDERFLPDGYDPKDLLDTISPDD